MVVGHIANAEQFLHRGAFGTENQFTQGASHQCPRTSGACQAHGVRDQSVVHLNGNHHGAFQAGANYIQKHWCEDRRFAQRRI
jgi:hypothetical protein